MSNSEDPFPAAISIGDKYDPATKIADEAAADAYFARCVEHTMRVAGVGQDEAVSIEKANLGYWAGYYDNETRARVERLFRCAHPIFGAIAERGPPSPAECLAAGLARGLKLAGRS